MIRIVANSRRDCLSGSFLCLRSSRPRGDRSVGLIRRRSRAAECEERPVPPRVPDVDVDLSLISGSSAHPLLYICGA